MKLLPTSLLFGCSFGQIEKWQFEIESTVYEALVDPVRLGFWESKAYCDGLGAAWQLPTPTNAAEVRNPLGVKIGVFFIFYFSFQNEAVAKMAAKGNIYLGIAQQLEEGGNIFEPWFNVYTGKAISYSQSVNNSYNVG